MRVTVRLGSVRVSVRRPSIVGVPVIGAGRTVRMTVVASSIVGMSMRRMVVGMTVVVTMNGMLGGITVVIMVGRFVHLGRFQI